MAVSVSKIMERRMKALPPQTSLRSACLVASLAFHAAAAASFMLIRFSPAPAQAFVVEEAPDEDDGKDVVLRISFVPPAPPVETAPERPTLEELPPEALARDQIAEKLPLVEEKADDRAVENVKLPDVSPASITPALLKYADSADNVMLIPHREKRSAADARSRFLLEVAAKIQKAKRYPVSAMKRSAEGSARIEFRLSGDGEVVSARLVLSSGSTTLDDEALAMIFRAAPYPSIPRELGVGEMLLELPVVFRIDR